MARRTKARRRSDRTVTGDGQKALARFEAGFPLSFKEVVIVTGIGKSRLYRLLAERKGPPFLQEKKGGSRIFPAADLKAWLERWTQRPADPSSVDHPNPMTGASHEPPAQSDSTPGN